MLVDKVVYEKQNPFLSATRTWEYARLSESKQIISGFQTDNCIVYFECKLPSTGSVRFQNVTIGSHITISILPQVTFLSASFV